MKTFNSILLAAATLIASLSFSGRALAEDSYNDALATFQKASETHKFFNTAYGLSLIHI